MKITSYRIILMLSAFGFIAPLLGCGGGGRAAGLTESRGPSSSDPTANSPTTSPVVLEGCGTDAFSPNFAAQIHPMYHWNRFPVKVFFTNNIMISHPDGDKSDLRSIALSGFQEWSDATGNMVVIQVVADEGSADIVVHLTSLQGLPAASDVLGIEQSTLYSNGALHHADIKLNVWPTMTHDNIASFQETASHEFGHALGINGHSDNPNDVMYASHSLYAFKSLSVRDVNTFKNAYCGMTGKSARLPLGNGTSTTTIN